MLRYKLLGKTGLRVSEACLGTMTFGEEWGFGSGKDECKKMLDAFAQAGGNFIDTANLYTNGTSERFVGELVQGERDKWVIATKYTLMQRPGDPNSAGNHRKSMTTALEASLRRLGTDYVDLYWVHAADLLTPVDETMRALDDAVRAGKILYVGVSDTPAWMVSQANTLAALRGWSPFVALQIEYSLIQRTPERDLLPMAKSFGLTVTPWGAIGGGVLSGKYRREGGTAVADDSKRVTGNQSRATEKNLVVAELVQQIAKETGKTPAQVALAWLRGVSPSILPILGARTLTQLEDNLGAFYFRLTDDQMKRLGDASAIELGFPHDFLRSDFVKKVTRTDVWDRIDE